MPTVFYSPAACFLHPTGNGHPESALRLQAISDQLIASRTLPLLDIGELPAASSGNEIAMASATGAVDPVDAAVLRVHSQTVLDRLRQAAASAHGEDEVEPDTRIVSSTLQAARAAVSAVLAATDRVMAGQADNAFCAIRPPGHHATPDQPMGFCFLNNVVIAARHALAQHGLQRVAIVDFDVHHGNGTEAAVAGDECIMMAGFFQHPFYPFSGVHDSAAAAANLCNMPLPAYSDGAAVRTIFDATLLPALRAFRPEMIFISAGFDAHREDEMAQMGLTEANYVWMTQQIMAVAAEFAHGRIVSCLEGGYDLSSLGRSVVAHVRTLAQLDD